jgi:hypothetical protein
MVEHKEPLSDRHLIKDPTDIWTGADKQTSNGGSTKLEELSDDGNCLTGDHCQVEIGNYDSK